MAITQALCTTFKEELMLGGHDFSTSGASAGTFNIALYTSSATLGASTTAYTNSGEVSSNNTYTAGGPSAGQQLTVNTAPGNGGSGTVVFTSFATKTFSAVTITARGALIYNSTPAGNASGRTNPAVIVLNFVTDKSSSSGDFTIQFPTADASNAVIRIN
tara:strand:- start:17397 stop:17876 length:480 start_codon:yes stop_codon:yes gene_type:complete